MRRRRYGLAALSLVAAISALAGMAFRGAPARTSLATSPARPTVLSVTMTAGGQVDSSKRTVIECELEAMAIGVQGQSVASSGASTLLSIVDDGSEVKKGDILAVLDASDYEEMVRTQTMNVDRARADRRQAELTLEVAELAVGEYRDGLMEQTLEAMEGQIALAKADKQRAADRLAWSRRMIGKGYISQGQLSTEEFALLRQGYAIQQGMTALRIFRDFGAPMWLKVLDSDVKGAEAILNYQDRRVQRHEERLAKLKLQVDHCTIRAPHDGFVIHANEKMKALRIEPGMPVRQKQRLMYLPDLTHMEVATQLHESVAAAVRPGMRSRIRIEAMGGRELEGHVTAIAQLPTPTNIFSEVRYFIATVQLDTLPRGLRPGMSAQVEIETLFRPDVLTVPAEALTTEDGHDVCYVAHDDSIERREIQVGQTTTDLLEVTSGLDEGEEVVLEPALLKNSAELVEIEPSRTIDANAD